MACVVGIHSATQPVSFVKQGGGRYTFGCRLGFELFTYVLGLLLYGSNKLCPQRLTCNLLLQAGARGRSHGNECVAW